MSGGEQGFWIFGSLTRWGLPVDRVHPAEIWEEGEGGIKHRKSRGCKTREEAVEDAETTDLSAMAK